MTSIDRVAMHSCQSTQLRSFPKLPTGQQCHKLHDMFNTVASYMLNLLVVRKSIRHKSKAPSILTRPNFGCVNLAPKRLPYHGPQQLEQQGRPRGSPSPERHNSKQLCFSAVSVSTYQPDIVQLNHPPSF
jgi:hypothetical protein